MNQKIRSIIPSPQRLFIFVLFFLCGAAAISKPAGILLDIKITGTNCGYSNGSITVVASNGTAPYTFSITGKPAQANGNFFALPSGTYTVTVNDAAGQTASQTVTLTNTFPQPVVTVTNSTIATGCTSFDGTVTIKATGGKAPYTYSEDLLHFQTSNIFSNLTLGLYQLYARDANGCLGEYTFGSSTMCLGIFGFSYTTFSCTNEGYFSAFGEIAGFTHPYSYSIDDIHFQISPLFKDLAPGLYRYYIKDATGKLTSFSINIIPKCDLVISALQTNADCNIADGSITVTTSGGTAPYVYSLDGIHFQSSPIFTGLIPGNYIITVQDFNGATNSLNGTIVGGVCPAVSLSATNANCARNNGILTANGGGGTAPYTYSIDGTRFQSSTDFTGLAAGNYTVTIKDAAGLTATATAAITNTVNTLTLKMGTDPSVCQGDNIQLQAVSNGNSFSWMPVSGLNDPSLLNPLATPAATTTYSLTASDGTCDSTASLTVTVNPLPVADPGQDEAVCYGENIRLQASGGVGYAWSPSDYLSNATISNPLVVAPLQTTIYHLKVTDANGCVSAQDASVKISVTPTAVVDAGGDTSIGYNQPLQLNARDVNKSGFTQYRWSPATGLNNPDISNPVATLTSDITYTVTAIAPGDCEASATVSVKLYPGPALYVPNAFTPNGDGHNDILKVIPIGIKTFRYFSVFNRWGQRIFFSNDPGRGWDGLLNGVLQPEGGYIWMAEGLDYKGNSIRGKGSVLLIR